MKVICVVGVRPNFMKMAPVVRALSGRGLSVELVHTGQHYDKKMSDVFFAELGMPEPDINLGVGSGSHAQQTARVMVEFEEVCQKRKPDLVLAGGDVNSTVAVSLVAAKFGISVGHVESGLRSFDRGMPEEINRVVTDHLSDVLFVTEQSGLDNLKSEGLDPEKVHFVGNTMIDSLMLGLDRAIGRAPWEEFDFSPGEYGLVTLHRPSNVDDPNQLMVVTEILAAVGEMVPLVFPVHPRSRARLRDGGLKLSSRVLLVDPLPYLDFLGMMAKARLVLTDSGGIQEETTALGVPCLTMRENTERPSTIECGTNILVGTNQQAIVESVKQILGGKGKQGRRPPLWDGKAADRIADVVVSFLGAEV